MANALLYLLRTGCPWRALPHDLPSWMTVWWYFRKWRDDGTLDRLHGELRDLSRQKAGRKKESTAGIVDSQSAKTTEKGGRAATTLARKFRDASATLSSDTMGHLLGVLVHPGDVQDRDGAKPVIESALARFPSLKKIWADGAYSGALVEWAADKGPDLELVKKPKEGFEVLPRRWVVERTFAWIVRNRRLRCDYEATVKSATAYVLLAMIATMVRRLRKAR